MDKRFFLALLLTAGVVLATPVIFRSPAPLAPVATESPVPSGAPSAPATGMVTAPSAASSAGTIGTAPTASVPVEVHALTNSLTRMEFSNYGAQLTRVELPRFRRLGVDSGTAALESATAPMLGLRLITGRDTLALQQQPFVVTREANATGEALRFSTTIGSANIVVRYALADSNYLTQVSVEATGLAQPSYLLLDLPSGFASQEADSAEDFRHLAYAYKQEKRGASRIDFRKPDPGERMVVSGPFTWAVGKNKYFLVGVLAPEGQATPFAELHVMGEIRRNKVATQAHGTVIAPLGSAPVTFELYAGPQEWKRLVDLGREFQNANPYGGWIAGIVQPFATIVMRMLLWLKGTLGWEYGWILVFFGVAVRLVLWPLNSRAMRSQMKMAAIAPQLQEAQKKHGSDPDKYREATMRIYQEAGMSPLSPLAGCLPLMLPMPIFFALFFVFQNTIEFRGVPFLWLPDISVKDPFYITPIVMGVSMFLLSWMGQRNQPPNPQAKMMAYLLPPVFTFALLNFASGLNLYYTVQNLAALPQTWLIARERAKQPTTPARQ